MNNFDPLVANGIVYAPIKDIVMSDTPIYDIKSYKSPYLNNPYPKQDTYNYKSKKSNSLLKYLLGLGVLFLAYKGVKKYGRAPIENFLKNHPKITNIKNAISANAKKAFEFCKNHIYLTRKKP